MIEVRGVTKRAGDRTVLDGVDLNVPRGETVALIGPSGAGKSTLLRCLNGLEPFQRGEIRVAGRAVPSGTPTAASPEILLALRRQVGMVFQAFNLFPHLTVLENLCLAPQKVLGRSRSEAEAAAVRLLGEVNMSGTEHRLPRQLSGGEQQRVAIARALAMEPQVMLFDEPTSSLDPERVLEVVEVIERLARLGYTLLIVTHQMAVARRVASRVLFLDAGKIVEDSPSEVFFRAAATERAREFLRCVQLSDG